MPDITADTPRKDLTIRGIILSAAMPYEEGHVLTANEASVVNQTWLENLRNNYAAKLLSYCETNHPEVIVVDDKENKQINTSEENGNAVLSPAQVAEIQKDFTAYVDGYEFGVRGAGRTLMDPVMALAIGIAEGVVKDALKAQGYKISDVRDQVRGLAEKAIADNPLFMEEARKLHASRQEAAKSLTISLPPSE